MDTQSLTPQETGAGLFARIETARKDMTPKLQGIANFVLAEPTRFIKMTSKEVCALLNTSDPTLIRFCQNFGYSGLAEFRIDLAVDLATQGDNTLKIEPMGSDRRDVNADAKKRIALRARDLLMQDRSIIMDNGSSVEMLAKHLGEHEGLTVMTSGLGVAQNALQSPQHRVMLTGGEIRGDTLAMGGRLVEMSIREMRFDTAYIGADSIDPNGGISTFLEDEAHQTRAMVFASRRLVVLADGSKFNKPSLHWICDVEQIDTLVTDAPLSHPAVKIMIGKGVTVLSTQKE